MNRLESFKDIFAPIQPWAGEVPRGFCVDFMGTLTDVSFRQSSLADPSSIGGRYIETTLPLLDDMAADRGFDIVPWQGERWFEAVNWFVAAREARDQFVMMTLGAWHGAQAVGSYRALQCVNPMPCRLIAVEPLAESLELMRRHFRNNGIDPDDHCLIPMAVSDNREPVLLAVGPRSLGAMNYLMTNEPAAREAYYARLVESGMAEQALRQLLRRNSTGITIPGRNETTGEELAAELKFVSATTLDELLGPFDMVDYLDSDIQESEILVFPPFMDLVKRKVRRVHIGTHGKAVHWSVHELFASHAWEVVFNYEPDTVHETVLGTFKTGDGLLTFRNPDL
jgi:hypothetical protein